MDYAKLAMEFMEKMHSLRKTKPQKMLDESMRGEMVALHCIFRRGTDVQPSEISSEIDISTARIAATLNSLEKKGLVTREIDKNDRRKILVNLTPEGKELATSVGKEMIENIAKAFSFLGEKDAEEYVRLTGKIAEIMKSLQI